MPQLADQIQHPVYLVSGELPGTGSSTVAGLIGERATQAAGIECPVINLGQAVRDRLGVTSEADWHEAIAHVPDPAAFDAQFYHDLPQGPVVLEGKLATRLGPTHISDRPLVCVDLRVDPFQSALRVMERELQIPYQSIFNGGARTFVDYYRRVRDRQRHIKDLRSAIETPGTRDDTADANISRFTFDTSLVSAKEIVDTVTGTMESPVTNTLSSGISRFAANLASMAVQLDAQRQHPLDREHFKHSFGNLQYQMRRLDTNSNPAAATRLRNDIFQEVVDSTFSLFMRSVPRFYEDVRGEPGLDETSLKWTPEFYKIAMAMPTLRAMIEGKSILDPFGGAGSLMSYLAAKKIPSSIVCSDLCYPGGEFVNDKNWYSPMMNRQSIMALFSSLPSWCRPDFSRIKGTVTADARKLPFADNAFDMIVGDPPYGINCTQGDAQVMEDALPEMLRVSKEGVLMMIPDFWFEKLKNSSYKVERLTEDLSGGVSNLPISYIFISK